MIKMICLLKRKAPLTHEAFVEHWLNVHGPLALQAPSIRRYVQSHITETQSRPDVPDLPIDIDGVAELWFDDYQSMSDSQYDEGMQRLLADGATFIGEIKTYVVEEKNIVPAAPR
jgi:uncharacterized protein (TIGR02118 family)